jgi:sugar phosphate isomerase/epimerase
MTIQSVGLQLYAVRDEMARDFSSTLRRVAEMGYKGVEFAGYGKVSSKEMAALLADLGLRAFGSHVGLLLLEQNLNYEIDYCLDIGCPYIAIPTLTPQWRSRDGSDYRRLAAYLNTIGQRCHQQGISLVYHNHDFDFVQDGQNEGQYLLDILLAETDPTYLQLELDSGWAAYSGVDTLSYLQKYAGRVPLIHLKDMTSQRTFAEIGDGTLDIAAYYKAALASGTRYYLVDNDTPRHPSLESVHRSLENLEKILSTNSEDLHVSRM